jgi:hypothetical protein
MNVQHIEVIKSWQQQQVVQEHRTRPSNESKKALPHPHQEITSFVQHSITVLPVVLSAHALQETLTLQALPV